MITDELEGREGNEPKIREGRHYDEGRYWNVSNKIVILVSSKLFLVQKI